jgi:hypothetical protein
MATKGRLTEPKAVARLGRPVIPFMPHLKREV